PSFGIARFGHASTASGPGNIVLTATSGSISLNDSPGVVQGGAIRTTGNVALHADAPGGSITETVRGVIAANALTTSSGGGTNLAGTGNAVSSFSATATTGSIL